MDSLTINQTTNLVHRINKDGNQIWHLGAKTLLVLPNEAVSVKNKLELIRGLREHGYLQCDETLDKEAYWHFRTEADKLKRNAERIIAKSGNSGSEYSIADFKHALTQYTAAAKQHNSQMKNMEDSNENKRPEDRRGNASCR